MTQPPSPKLIVGLGNPGNEYAETRHNAGVWFVEQLLQRYPASSPLALENKFFGLAGQIIVANQPVRILIPQTFMNNSGQSVAAMANFYKIDSDAILVVHDELDLNPGICRLKHGGGHGGHNGLRDITVALGNNNNFSRLRIGIGHPGSAKHVSSFVLKSASSAERLLIDQAIDEAVNHIEAIVNGQWQLAMNTLHSFEASRN